MEMSKNFMMIGAYTIILALAFMLTGVQPSWTGLMVGGVVNVAIGGLLGLLNRGKS